MIKVGLAAFAMFFVTVAPVKSMPVFVTLTRDRSAAERRGIAGRAVLYATLILTAFSAFGDDLLRVLGISLPAIRIGGGVLLMLMAIQMVFGTHGGMFDEHGEGREPDADVAVFPIATPIIAGPGTITAVMVLMSHHPTFDAQAVIFVALLAVLLLTYLLFIAATTFGTVIGESAMAVISRVMGVLLMALAAEFVVQGVRDGLLAR
jgi:multiple antibiotic resistance protein